MNLKYFFSRFFLDFLRLVRGYYIYIKNFRLLSKNNILKGIKKGKTVFILANGPSLNNFDRSILDGKDVIVMNNFDLCKWKNDVNIVAHCIGEPIESSHWGDDQIEISNNTNAKNYWYHYSVRSHIMRYENIDKSKSFFFMAPVIPEKFFFNKSIDLSSVTLGYSTTAQMSIMVAVFMGYNKINLLGFDHDLLKNRNIVPHFYEEGKGAIVVDKSNHSYFSLMKYYIKMWDRYYCLKKVADKNNIQIINLTKNSFLDVFPQS